MPEKDSSYVWGYSMYIVYCILNIPGPFSPTENFSDCPAIGCTISISLNDYQPALLSGALKIYVPTSSWKLYTCTAPIEPYMATAAASTYGLVLAIYI